MAGSILLVLAKDIHAMLSLPVPAVPSHFIASPENPEHGGCDVLELLGALWLREPVFGSGGHQQTMPRLERIVKQAVIVPEEPWMGTAQRWCLPASEAPSSSAKTRPVEPQMQSSRISSQSSHLQMVASRPW